MASETANVSREALHRILLDHFSEEELRTLCFHLSVEYDDLAGRSRADKARELIKHLARREQIPNLLQTVKRQRPDLHQRIENLPSVDVSEAAFAARTTSRASSGAWIVATTIGGGVGGTMGALVNMLFPTGTGGALGYAVIGAIVGTLQWMLLQRWIRGSGWWILASVIGWGIGAPVAVREFGPQMAAFFYGALLGLLQFPILGKRVKGSGAWIVASTIGWGIGGVFGMSVAGAVAGGIGGIPGEAAGWIAGWTIGSLICAVITGIVLTRMLQRRTTTLA